MTPSTLQLLGTRFVIRGDLSVTLEQLWDPFRSQEAAPDGIAFTVDPDDGGVSIEKNGQVLARCLPTEAALARVNAELNREAISATDLFAVHAAVLGDRDRALAIVSPSGGGKSTLAAALLREGMSYGSDEALCLDPIGLIVPYPKPLALDRASCRLLGLPLPAAGEAWFTAADLGAQLLEGGRQPTHLLLLVPSEAPLHLTPASPSAVVASLLENSFNHFRHPEMAFELSTRLAGTVKAFYMGRSDPLTTARFLLSQL